MFGSIAAHAHHHIRFYLAALFGVAVWFVTREIADTSLRLALAGDGFFSAYLLTMIAFTVGVTPEHLRRRADIEDEGATLIVVITIAAISLSLGAIFEVLNRGTGMPVPLLVFSVASVPLGWLTLHVVSAFHYAHIYYGHVEAAGKKREDAGGLNFPRTKEPGALDFLYYSFVVGMTAQVSDVQVETTRLRTLTLVHSVVSFFYNTVLLALAVNVVVSMVH